MTPFIKCGMKSLLLVLLTLPLYSKTHELPKNGLVLHLDSSRLESIKLDDEKKVVRWADLSGNKNDATADSKHAPKIIKQAINYKDALRFSEKQCLSIPKLSNSASGYSIFIVFQRTEALTSDSTWQRLISSNNTAHPHDTKVVRFTWLVML